MQLSWHICSTGVWPARGKENVTTDGKEKKMSNIPQRASSEKGNTVLRPVPYSGIFSQTGTA